MKKAVFITETELGEKKINFFLSYEGNGKANLFYSIYPRKSLTDINFQKFNDDNI